MRFISFVLSHNFSPGGITTSLEPMRAQYKTVESLQVVDTARGLFSEVGDDFRYKKYLLISQEAEGANVILRVLNIFCGKKYIYIRHQ